jgi:hypothetical protein
MSGMISGCLQLDDRSVKPTISVLMSVYNGAAFLREAVDSILSQTFSDFEFIIVDDGSTDQTPDILDSYSDPRIVRIKNETNIGMTNSLVRALGITRGAFIARQDADDISISTRLERQLIEISSRPELATISSDYQTIDDTGDPTGIIYSPKGPQNIRETLFYTNCVCHGSILMRRDKLMAVGSYNPACEPAEDYELWLRLSERYAIDCIPEVLYRLRVYPASTATGLRRPEMRRTMNQIRVAAFERTNGADLSPRIIALHHFSVALHEISEGHIEQGAERLRKAADADSTLEEALDQLVNMTVTLAVELGPSGRGLIKTAVDADTGLAFVRTVIASLPPARLARFCSEVLAEYHAACAYLFTKQRRTWPAVQHIAQSWKAGPRHRQNRGLVRALIGATRS